jgi:hypothetical protein
VISGKPAVIMAMTTMVRVLLAAALAFHKAG